MNSAQGIYAITILSGGLLGLAAIAAVFWLLLLSLDAFREGRWWTSASSLVTTVILVYTVVFLVGSVT